MTAGVPVVQWHNPFQLTIPVLSFFYLQNMKNNLYHKYTLECRPGPMFVTMSLHREDT